MQKWRAQKRSLRQAANHQSPEAVAGRLLDCFLFKKNDVVKDGFSGSFWLAHTCLCAVTITKVFDTSVKRSVDYHLN